MTHVAQSKMTVPKPANINAQNSNKIVAQGPTVPSQATLQTDAVVQEELKALEDSLGNPILLGISDDLGFGRPRAETAGTQHHPKR